MEDFEQQEKAFKEDVALAKERNAQKKASLRFHQHMSFRDTNNESAVCCVLHRVSTAVCGYVSMSRLDSERDGHRLECLPGAQIWVCSSTKATAQSHYTLSTQLQKPQQKAFRFTTPTTTQQRAKAEARLAVDQERMKRLREDVMGSDGDANEVEAKTANWQKFNSKMATKRRTAGGASGRRENIRKSPGLGVGRGDGAGQERASAGPDAPKAAGEKAAGSGFVCWVCRRGFKSVEGLANHEAKSELHDINVQLREFLSP